MKLNIALLYAIACSLALPLKAAPILTLFNTGVSSNNRLGTPDILTPTGQPDEHYSITGGIAGILSPTVTGTTAYPFPPWNPDTATSEWISPQALYLGFLRDPAGTYTYRTTFDLTGYDARTVSISGQAVADNAITAIRINGFDINYSHATTTFAFSPFSIPNGHYLSGVNTLQFTVYNSNNLGGGNPSGLRVELTGTGAISDVRDDGQFTLLLEADSDVPGSPQGTGYATMTVGGKGGVVLAGKLADGESFSATGVIDTGTTGTSFLVSKNLIYPSVTVKNAKGTLVGTLNFDTNSYQGDIFSDIDGSLEWTKPQQKTGADPAAFDTDLFVAGSLYAYVTGSSVLPGFPVVGGTTSGTLQLSDSGGLYLLENVQLSSSNQLVITNPPDGLNITIIPSTGVFKGTFMYPGTIPKLTEFTGVLFQDQSSGQGFFVGPQGIGVVNLSP